MQPALFAVLGFCVGAISGFFGVGGAVLIIPTLVLCFGFNQLTAQGTSMAMLLPPIGLMAAYHYWKAGHVNILASAILAATFFLGAAFSSHFAIEVPHLLMKRLFGGLLIILGVITLVFSRQ